MSQARVPGAPQKEESRQDKYDRQTAEAHASLGRFVQSFELMVDAVRTASLFLLSRRSTPAEQGLLSIVLNHHAMSAQPLMDILRAVSAEATGDPIRFIEESDRAISQAIMTYIQREYGELVKVRNELIHGTWYIGWTNASEGDFSGLQVHKLKPNKGGLGFVDQPTTITELDAISKRCMDVRALVVSFTTVTLPGKRQGFQDVFVAEGDRWETTAQVT